MPRTASALAERRDDEAVTKHVDELIRLGRRQGYLLLPELRTAFDQARISPTEARSILRELAEEGVQLGHEQAARPRRDTAATPGGPGPADREPSEVELAEVTHAELELAEIDLGGQDLAMAHVDDADLATPISPRSSWPTLGRPASNLPTSS